MRTLEEIKKAIEAIENTYDAQDMPEFVRGQYNALKWILEEVTQ